MRQPKFNKKKHIPCMLCTCCCICLQADACEVVLKMTLKETECHIVNPKHLDQCNIRSESETVS